MESIQPQRKVVTVKEAAAMLAVSQLTILRAIKDGKLKAMQISPKGRYKISIENLSTFIREHTR